MHDYSVGKSQAYRHDYSVSRYRHDRLVVIVGVLALSVVDSIWQYGASVRWIAGVTAQSFSR
jgi:hypothetical protein